MYIQSVNFRRDFPANDAFPFNIKVFRLTENIEISSPICFFVGENGSGKSALLDAISRKAGLLPWGGTKIHRVHKNPYETQLASHIDLTWRNKSPYGFYFRSEAFFNFAASLDDILMDDPGRAEYFGGKSLNVQSHGESFLSFFEGYSFQLSGLYLLDEPEAALSPGNQVELVRLLVNSANRGDKQYIIATHSPIILGCPGSQILSFDHPRITGIQFKETRIYRFYESYLRDPEKFYADLTVIPPNSLPTR
jgi:predicted ATPase